MATGDRDDIASRLLKLLPRWWADENPVLGALLSTIASGFAFVYSLYEAVKLQTRLATCSGAWLDLAAADFFGTSLKRLPNQSDTSLRASLRSNLFRERGTRRGIASILRDLTGVDAQIFEPTRPADTGVYGGPLIGYGVAGGYGSVVLPFQAFITIRLTPATGIPLVAGYRIQTGGYGQSSRAEYASLDMAAGRATLAQIYAAVDAAKPVGSIMWVAVGPRASRLPTSLGLNFVLGNSALG